MQIPHGKFEVLDSFCGIFLHLEVHLKLNMQFLIMVNSLNQKSYLKEISLNLRCYNLHGIVLSRFSIRIGLEKLQIRIFFFFDNQELLKMFIIFSILYLYIWFSGDTLMRN